MRHANHGVRCLAMLVIIISWLPAAEGQKKPSKRDEALLGRFSGSVERLVRMASPAVVQITTTGFGPVEEGNSGVVTSQSGTGSGVILSPDGYIITNAHVVEGAQRIRVRLLKLGGTQADDESGAARQSSVLQAKVVGVDSESDLAVIKVEQKDLPVLTFADSDKIHQGQVVLAVGSPLGLQNSVTLGVISSVARQIQPDDTMIYIQTDAPINPGNSGGPLVDTKGRMVGINTLILSQSGGSEGIGFAAPSNIVRSVYEQLKRDGHVHRAFIGVRVKRITPILAGGLDLPREWGVILEDVIPEGPAEQAGLKIGDIILSIDGKEIENPRQFESILYQHAAGESVKFIVLRGKDKISLSVTPEQRVNDPYRFMDLVNQNQNLISDWGIFVLPLDQNTTDMLPELRKPAGVVVAARVAEPRGIKEFEAGDLICALNGQEIRTFENLKAGIAKIKPGDPVVVQVQRQGQLMFISFEMP